ncbi:MAG: hypothetical protein HZC01_03725 [Candidatus Kerfeldbacteria bacterium]|nr:hypothetical protein [Candidatus Kerfeldbacteria bacterium]
MSETHDKSSQPSAVVGSALDTVNGLFEGIGQFVRERPIKDIVIAWIMGAVTTKVAASSLRNFLDNDPLADELHAENRRRLRAELELDAEKFLNKCRDVLESIGEKFEEWAAADKKRGAELLEQAASRFAGTKNFSWLADFCRPTASQTTPAPVVSSLIITAGKYSTVR